MPPTGKLVTPKDRRFFAEGEPILVRWDGPPSKNMQASAPYASSKLYLTVVDCSRLPKDWRNGLLNMRKALASATLNREIVYRHQLRRFFEEPIQGADKPGYYALLVRADTKLSGHIVADPTVELLVRLPEPSKPQLRFPATIWAGYRVDIEVETRFPGMKAQIGFATWKPEEDVPVVIPLCEITYIEMGTSVPCMFEPGTWKLSAVLVDADSVFRLGTLQPLTVLDPAETGRELDAFAVRIARTLYLGARDRAWELEKGKTRWIAAETLTRLRTWELRDGDALDNLTTLRDGSCWFRHSGRARKKWMTRNTRGGNLWRSTCICRKGSSVRYKFILTTMKQRSA